MPTDRIVHHFAGSSWIARAWYSPAEKLIEVEYIRDGHRHLFFNCEPGTWDRFTKADSAGHFVRLVLERHTHRSR